MLYRRTAAEMSGYVHEMEAGRLDGVTLVERAVPKAFERDGAGRLTGVALVDGRVETCDMALVAIGQARIGALARRFPGVEVDPTGRVVVDAATGATGNPKVFAGGDAVSGGELVVTAVQDGKRAARGIAAACGIEVRANAAMNAGHR
jgi:glutamate synthase (NADPH/NADH) small chain